MNMIDTALSIYEVMDCYLIVAVFAFAFGLVWSIDFKRGGK